MKLSGYHLHTLRFHFRRGSTFRGTFFQDGRQFTMLYVQTCLVRGPNKVEDHRRCHFQLHQGCRLICRNQISPQIKHGCQLCPHVQCGCVCLSNVQRCLVGYQIAQENTSNVISTISHITSQSVEDKERANRCVFFSHLIKVIINKENDMLTLAFLHQCSVPSF